MNSSRNISSLLVIPCVALLIGLACNQDKGSSTPAGNLNVANGSSTPTSNTEVAVPSKDVSGTYSITGENEGGGGAYAGDLIVTKRDEVYQFSWKTGATTYDGVGVQSGNSVGVAFTEGNDGKGCGVVLYRIQADGSLEGKAGYWGVNEAETETATRTSGTDLEGSYDVKGSAPDGQSYTGKLTVKKQAAGYSFEWNTGNTLKGFGIRGANMVAVGIGGSQCGFVGYDVQADGSLQGKWGSPGSTSVGTEVAKRK